MIKVQHTRRGRTTCAKKKIYLLISAVTCSSRTRSLPSVEPEVSAFPDRSSTAKKGGALYYVIKYAKQYEESLYIWSLKNFSLTITYLSVTFKNAHYTLTALNPLIISQMNEFPCCALRNAI